MDHAVVEWKVRVFVVFRGSDDGIQNVERKHVF